MKVSDLLQIPNFRDFKIVAGEKGADREIRNINMMDAPDIIDYLKPNDWLVTSGYHLQNNPQFFAELVREMSALGCAALGIKTRRFMNDIPEEVLRLADERSFPLIDIPNRVPLVDIVNQTLTLILNDRTKELQFAIDTHQQFTEHIMSGEGIDRLLKTLSDMIGFPALLLDSYFKTMAASLSRPVNSDMTAHLSAMEQAFFQRKTNYFSVSFIDTRETYTLFTLYTYKKKRYFLLIAGSIPLSNRLLVLTVEQAANVLAFELVKDEALKQSFRKIRDAFFANLVSGSFSTEEEIVNRAKEFQLPKKQMSVCIVGRVDTDERQSSFTKFQMETSDVYDYLEGEIVNLPFKGHFFVKDQYCVLLMELGVSWDEARKRLLPFLKKMQKRVGKFFPHTVSFGISNMFTDLLDIPSAYQEATDALQDGLQLSRRSFIQVYRSKGIMDILRMVPTDDLEKLYQETFQNLAFPVKEEDHALLHTLFVYLESNCQISETAKKLYVHRNTVIYRIEKCENLLGIQLKDPGTTFRLRFAFRLNSLLKEQEPLRNNKET
ncbi:PucR family transcriptional regulator [Sporolactobacillus sp. THM7-7]|nr:PucR family transcriptional regulator [Sporolactobacillus sp. THM7-7]